MKALADGLAAPQRVVVVLDCRGEDEQVPTSPAECPACGEEIEVRDDVPEGHELRCTCGAKLVVFLWTDDDSDDAYVELQEAQS